MRIAKEHISMMDKCKTQKFVSNSMSNAELSVAQYLVSRNFMSCSEISVEEAKFTEYTLSEEGKAYLYEYKDMKRARYFSILIPLFALIISIISLIINIFG